jgi:hypothetical protein
MIPLRERGAIHLTARSKAILNKPHILEAVDEAVSGTEIYNTVISDTGNNQLAKAARCLFFLKLYHRDDYLRIKLISNHNDKGDCCE